MKGIIHGFLLTISAIWIIHLIFMACIHLFSSPYDFGWPQALITCFVQFYLISFGFLNFPHGNEKE